MKNRSVMLWVIIAGLIAGIAFVCPVLAQSEGPSEKSMVENDYSQPSSWLCRPGQQDACTVDNSSTIISSDGTFTLEEWAADPNAPIDCFYVYPTVSLDQTPNSDMIAGPEEKSVIHQQFARFASQCRVYAPLYRQVTLTTLRAGIAGQPMAVDRNLGYNDILSAWNYYLKNDNKGRGVVLIGHSQGSGVLSQLIRKEIDGKPIQSQIVSALLIGTSVQIPKDKDVGGTFKHMPLCHAANQTGCIITYASFRSTVPPPESSRFGRGQGDLVSACTNPSELGGDGGELHAYMASSRGNLVTSTESFSWVTPKKAISTPFVSLPGLLTGKCVSGKMGSYLEITVHGDPADPRTDDILGDVIQEGKVQASWGLHLIDVNLAMGNLIDIVSQQSKAYLDSKKK